MTMTTTWTTIRAPRYLVAHVAVGLKAYKIGLFATLSM